jgi:flagellar protein FliS
MTNPYKHYQKTQVTTASREKILLMLYEGAIRFTKQARVAMQEKKVADKGKYISKATAILSELMATLDFKVGGQLAQDLENLYIFMIDKLIEGNVQNKEEPLEHVERLLNTLYSAWKDVVENPRPDGCPSPTLQPEEYKSYVATFTDEGKESPGLKRDAVVTKNPRTNLKIIA